MREGGAPLGEGGSRQPINNHLVRVHPLRSFNTLHIQIISSEINIAIVTTFTTVTSVQDWLQKQCLQKPPEIDQGTYI